MATITAIQKNGIKASRPNGNGLIHQVPELANLAGFTQVNTCDHLQVNEAHSPIKQEMEEDVCEEESSTLPPPTPIAPAEMTASQPTTEEPEIDIVINNVVCSFSVSCHLNLREIALNGTNVEYRKENGMITMKIRRPYTTASIWSSGKVTCTGATSEPQAKVAARRFARALQKLGFHVRFNNYRVVNVLGTCCMPFGIKINSFSERHKEAEYEPELHPGVTYKLRFLKATLKIFSTGSVTVTDASISSSLLGLIIKKVLQSPPRHEICVVAVLRDTNLSFLEAWMDWNTFLYIIIARPKIIKKVFQICVIRYRQHKFVRLVVIQISCGELEYLLLYYLTPSVADVQSAIEHIFPLVFEYRKERTPEEIQALKLRKGVQDPPEPVIFEMTTDE